MTKCANIIILNMTHSTSKKNQLIIKNLIDKVIAVIILVIASPFLLILASLIKLTSKGSILFKQERCGLNEKRFFCYKFRTMVFNAETIKTDFLSLNEMKGPVFKIKNDPRVTKIGSILRKTSLDELLQLFNVLKGDMSLVGPRPPIP